MTTYTYDRLVHTIVGTIEGYDISTEDGGCAKIAQLDSPNSDLFVRIQSYDESNEPVHKTFDELIRPGARYRVTIERWEQA